MKMFENERNNLEYRKMEKEHFYLIQTQEPIKIENC